ncbi:DENN domain-containing protein 4C [Allomyces arbusculus]|nr:DENN domain-containing protein 4C [Allomyces arbusculus]
MFAPTDKVTVEMAPSAAFVAATTPAPPTLLAHYVAVLELSIADERHAPVVRAAHVFSRTPTRDDHDHDNLLAALPLFCVPHPAVLFNAPDPPAPRFHEFVLTDAHGSHQYAACVAVPAQWVRLATTPSDLATIAPMQRMPSASSLFGARSVTCIVLVAARPLGATLRAVLGEILAVISHTRSTQAQDSVLERVIWQVLHQPILAPDLVVPGFAVQLRLPVSNVTVPLAPLPTDDAVTHVDFPLALVFDHVSINTILLGMAALLVDRAVLVVGSSITTIVHTCELLRALVHPPLPWLAVYVPILPDSLREMLDAPTVYLMGTPWASPDSVPSTTVVVDLTENRVWNWDPAEIELPAMPQLTAAIHAALGRETDPDASSSVHAPAPLDWRARNARIQAASLQWCAELLSGMRDDVPAWRARRRAQCTSFAAAQFLELFELSAMVQAYLHAPTVDPLFNQYLTANGEFGSGAPWMRGRRRQARCAEGMAARTAQEDRVKVQLVLDAGADSLWPSPALSMLEVGTARRGLVFDPQLIEERVRMVAADPRLRLATFWPVVDALDDALARADPGSTAHGALAWTKAVVLREAGAAADVVGSSYVAASVCLTGLANVAVEEDITRWVAMLGVEELRTLSGEHVHPQLRTMALMQLADKEPPVVDDSSSTLNEVGGADPVKTGGSTPGLVQQTADPDDDQPSNPTLPPADSGLLDSVPTLPRRRPAPRLRHCYHHPPSSQAASRANSSLFSSRTGSAAVMEMDLFMAPLPRSRRGTSISPPRALHDDGLADSAETLTDDETKQRHRRSSGSVDLRRGIVAALAAVVGRAGSPSRTESKDHPCLNDMDGDDADDDRRARRRTGSGLQRPLVASIPERVTQMLEAMVVLAKSFARVEYGPMGRPRDFILDDAVGQVAKSPVWSALRAETTKLAIVGPAMSEDEDDADDERRDDERVAMWLNLCQLILLHSFIDSTCPTHTATTPPIWPHAGDPHSVGADALYRARCHPRPGRGPRYRINFHAFTLGDVLFRVREGAHWLARYLPLVIPDGTPEGPRCCVFRGDSVRQQVVTEAAQFVDRVVVPVPLGAGKPGKSGRRTVSVPHLVRIHQDEYAAHGTPTGFFVWAVHHLPETKLVQWLHEHDLVRTIHTAPSRPVSRLASRTASQATIPDETPSLLVAGEHVPEWPQPRVSSPGRRRSATVEPTVAPSSRVVPEVRAKWRVSKKLTVKVAAVPTACGFRFAMD